MYNTYPSIHSILSADDIGNENRYPIIARCGIVVEMDDRLTSESRDFVL